MHKTTLAMTLALAALSTACTTTQRAPAQGAQNPPSVQPAAGSVQPQGISTSPGGPLR